MKPSPPCVKEADACYHSGWMGQHLSGRVPGGSAVAGAFSKTSSRLSAVPLSDGSKHWTSLGDIRSKGGEGLEVPFRGDRGRWRHFLLWFLLERDGQSAGDSRWMCQRFHQVRSRGSTPPETGRAPKLKTSTVGFTQCETAGA